MKQRFRHLLYLVLLVTLDQVSKIWAKARLPQKPITIIPGVLKLQYHENTGAVWGVMSGKTLFLTILTFIILIALAYMYIKIPQGKKYMPLQIAWIFIISGAIGNLVDRIFRKYVVDFIYFELIDFPIFNIADSYITVSCIFLLILVFFYYKEEDLEFLDLSLFKKKKSK